MSRRRRSTSTSSLREDPPSANGRRPARSGHPTKPRERERDPSFPFFWPRLRSRLSSPAVGTQSQSPISRTRRPNSFPPLDPIAQTGKEERSLSPSSLDPVPTRLVWPRRPKRERGGEGEREREREREVVVPGGLLPSSPKSGRRAEEGQASPPPSSQPHPYSASPSPSPSAAESMGVGWVPKVTPGRVGGGGAPRVAASTGAGAPGFTRGRSGGPHPAPTPPPPRCTLHPGAKRSPSPLLPLLSFLPPR